MKPLKIVTYNLRQENSVDGPQAFTYRKPYVRARLLEEAPDIVGFQEVKPEMLDWLRGSLAGYTVIGYGRGRTFDDEACPIAFKTDRFELQYFDQQWLSDTPHTPGSRYADQSVCPRVYVVCTLRDRESDGMNRFRFINTHLDHERVYARSEGAKQIISELARLDTQCKMPFVITGDFNDTPESQPLAVMTASGLRDLTAGSGSTFHAFGRDPDAGKIDYIMAPSATESCGLRLWNEMRDGLYLSDHYPVEATITGWGK